MSGNQTRFWLPLIALLVLALSFTMVSGVSADTFPEKISLPNGFAPEGIAVGTGSTFYAGSLATGQIYRGDLRTGEGAVLVTSPSGSPAVGLKYDERSGLLFVAGGASKFAFFYDGETGAPMGSIQLTPEDSFINDVVITKDAAYFTNSFQPEIYRIPLEKNGQLPDSPKVEVIELTGDYQFADGQFNANGIAATPNGKTLIIVNTWEGALYNVDPSTGEATLIDLGGDSVPNGDGILLQGKTLYVVQNFLNRVAVVELNPDLISGEVVDTIISPSFRIPTTIARFGGSFYVVNARFGTPVTPTTDYDVVLVPE